MEQEKHARITRPSKVGKLTVVEDGEITTG
jgi:hypothetical protein